MRRVDLNDKSVTPPRPVCECHTSCCARIIYATSEKQSNKNELSSSEKVDLFASNLKLNKVDNLLQKFQMSLDDFYTFKTKILTES